MRGIVLTFLSALLGTATPTLINDKIATTVQCPIGWTIRFELVDGVKIPKSCIRKYPNLLTWYQAEAQCRTAGAHLASAETQVNINFLRQVSLGATVWYGLRFTSGNWQYSGGQEFGRTRSLGMAPDDWDIKNNRLCAAMDESGVGSLTCSTKLPYVCSKPALNFNYKVMQLSIYGADFGESDPNFNSNTLTRITSEGLIIHSGRDIAIGSWISDTKFKAEYVAGTDCLWIFDAEKLTSGCVSSGRTTTATWALTPKYFPPPTEKPGTNGIPEKSEAREFAASPTNTPKPSVLIDGGGDIFNDQLQDTEPTSNNDSNNSIPTWVWPVAFGGVVMVAVVATVGGARNKKKKKSPPTSDAEGEGGPNSVLNSSEEERSDGGKASDNGSSNTGGGGGGRRKKHRSNISPENCETCKKFNEEATRARLYQVHRELANELRVPLQITGIHCDHTGSDHVHIFNVENEFTSYTLGVLSTCYSRVKPRLPKNTRIHIVHKKERQTLEGGADFLGDYDYYGAQYF